MDEDTENEQVESLEAQNDPQAIDEAEQAIPHKDPEDLVSNGDESSRNADDTEILDDVRSCVLELRPTVLSSCCVVILLQENGQPDAESEESQPHFALNDVNMS